ncbi:hypothetical protein E2C01_051701 [Portunus trituberculatus]|uniref:Uncharacterized protein n=1 Tax=Portunus trituberculatus TaxID=210409 RepID=A0A5B7GMG7_PORTR|nr:hypothetical protein [Portunus trituberculatus]
METGGKARQGKARQSQGTRNEGKVWRKVPKISKASQGFRAPLLEAAWQTRLRSGSLAGRGEPDAAISVC